MSNEKLKYRKGVELTLTEENLFGFIGYYESVSLAEIMRQFPDARGEGNMTLNNDLPNVILWAGISEKFLSVTNNLIKEKKILMVPADILVYMADGSYLNLPIAKKIHNYKKPHWLPVVFYTADGLPQHYRKKLKTL